METIRAIYTRKVPLYDLHFEIEYCIKKIQEPSKYMHKIWRLIFNMISESFFVPKEFLKELHIVNFLKLRN